MEGRFVPYELAEVTRDLFLAEKTGFLDVSRPGDAGLVFEFDRGMLQYAEKEGEEAFGQRLLREGKVSSGALADVVASGIAPREIGPALVRSGWISLESLSESFQSYLSSRLSEALGMRAGEYRFREVPVPQPPIEGDVIHTVDAFLQGVQAMAGFNVVKQALQELDEKLLLRPSGAIPVERLNLTAIQGFLLSRMDGSLSMTEILSTLPPHEEEPASRFIYALVLLGAAGFEPSIGPGVFATSSILKEHAREQAREEEEVSLIKAMYETSTDASPYAVLGIVEGAEWEQVENAYKARKAELAPERFLEKVRQQLRSELQIVEGRLVQARLALQSSLRPNRPEAKEPEEDTEGIDFDALATRRELQKTEVKMNQEEAARQADSYFQKARKYYQQGDFHNCIQYCNLALKYGDGVARIHHLLGEAQVRNPDHRWQKLAEQSFQRALSLDPWNADYLVTLGQFYRRQGLAMRARRQFERALEILPTHPVALEELSSLE